MHPYNQHVKLFRTPILGYIFSDQIEAGDLFLKRGDAPGKGLAKRAAQPKMGATYCIVRDEVSEGPYSIKSIVATRLEVSTGMTPLEGSMLFGITFHDISTAAEAGHKGIDPTENMVWNLLLQVTPQYADGNYGFGAHGGRLTLLQAQKDGSFTTSPELSDLDLSSLSDRMPANIAKHVINRILIVIGYLHAFINYIDQPRTYLFEEPPTCPRKPSNKSKKPKQLDERPVIHVLDPTAAKKIYAQRDDAGTHASPVPHDRRAYQRTYKHPRYINVRGMTQEIAATRVNAMEGETFKAKKHVYLVMKAGDDNPAEGLEL